MIADDAVPLESVGINLPLGMFYRTAFPLPP
jgi:hypothetical protein